MATLGAYKTASNNVEVKLEYSYSRASDGKSYTVTGTPYFHRTNTGYTTSGTVFSGLFVNGSRVATTSKYVSTSNSTWVSAGTMTYTKSGLSPTSDYTITIGFATCSEVANLATGKTATSYNVYPSSQTYVSGSITLAKTISYTACGKPTKLSVTDNGDGTFTLSATAGANGTSNKTLSVDLYYTIDGSTPTASNYRETFNIAATAGTVVSKTISFTELSTATASIIFGTDLAARVIVGARSCGAAGASYYSAVAVSTVAANNFTWRGRPTIPVITNPPSSGFILRQTDGFDASWLPPQDTANNTISHYRVYLVNKDSGAIEDSETVTDTSQLKGWLTAGETSGNYCVEVVAYCANGITSETARSNGTITVVPSVSYSAIDYHIDDYNCSEKATGVFAHRGEAYTKVYLDTGAGNICRIYWDDVSPSRDRPVIYYVLVFLVPQPASYVALLGGGQFEQTHRTTNTELYITSEMLKVAKEKAKALGYTLEDDTLDLVVNLYGVAADSSFIGTTAVGNKTPFKVAQASGVLKTSEVAGLTKATRSIAFVKNSDDHWQPAEDFLVREADNWVSSDIRYVSLLDSTGEPVVDINGEPVFIS